MFYVVFAILLSTTSFAYGTNSTRGLPTTWAEGDLAFIHNTIVENHPGIHNNLDPDFKARLDTVTAHAHRALLNATSDSERMQVLHEFGQQFDDIHLSVSFNINTQAQQSQKPSSENDLRRVWSIKNVTREIALIKIPHFAPKESEQKNVENVIFLIPTLQTTPYIVFDLRGNRGGSSFWGKWIANTLFGADYAKQKRSIALANQYIEWRASKGNITHIIDSLIPLLQLHFSPGSKEDLWLQKLLIGMEKAYSCGEPYYKDVPTYNDSLPDDAHCISHCTSTIIVLMDHECASACLDFIDELKRLGSRTVLTGETTQADSLYMEVRSIPLPSAKGTLRIPIKVYRNRQRGHNIPYTPDSIDPEITHILSLCSEYEDKTTATPVD